MLGWSPQVDLGHCCKAQALCEPGWVGSCLSLPPDRNCSSTGTKGLVGGVREASGEQQPLMCFGGVCRRAAAPGWGGDRPLALQGLALWGLVPEGSGLVCPVLLMLQFEVSNPLPL